MNITFKGITFDNQSRNKNNGFNLRNPSTFNNNYIENSMDECNINFRFLNEIDFNYC